MNAQQLFLAGRLLTRLGRHAMRGETAVSGSRKGSGAATGAGTAGVSASARAVLAEALARPGSAIGEIARRTGFLQSHVSAAVVHLRRRGLVMTVADPGDGRRTLVQPLHTATATATTTASVATTTSTSAAEARPSPLSVDAVLVQALSARLGAAGARHVAEVTRALEVIVNGLGPEGALQPRSRRSRMKRVVQTRTRRSRV
jgi:DNA-binding MarR family transcriptional regulator